MTVSKNLEITCNGCRESETWSLSVLRDRKLKTLLKNQGYTTESGNSVLGSKKHYCSDCNDRERDTFYVVDGYGEEYLGTVKAWGIVDARRVSQDTFECLTMVRRERGDVDPPMEVTEEPQ